MQTAAYVNYKKREIIIKFFLYWKSVFLKVLRDITVKGELHGKINS